MLKQIKFTNVSMPFIVLLTMMFVGCDSGNGQEQNDIPEIKETAALQQEEVKPEAEESPASVPPEPSVEAPMDTETETETVPGSFPKIELEVDEFDMGYIALEEITVKEMKVYNRGTVPLTITKVTSSCGCTSGSMREETIAPGEESIMEIRVDPKRFKGFQTTKVISLLSNDPDTPKATVRVTSRIRGEVKFSQKQVDFGVLNEEATAEQKIRMSQTQSELVTIQNIGIPDEFAKHITVEVVDIPEGEWKDEALAEHDLVIRVAPGLPVGAHKINIQLDLSHERYKDFKIPVTLGIGGAYTFKPDAITLRNVIPEEVQESVMVLSFTDNIKVISASIDNENIQISFKEGAEPNTYEFDVWVPENHELRLQRGELTVKLLLKGEEVEHKLKVLALLKR